MRHIGYFVTPHGFGHAARSAAVMRALQRRDESLAFEIFTTVPAWLFEDSGVDRATFHQVATDVGFVQATPLREDVPATLERLSTFLPFDSGLTGRLAERLTRSGCGLVVCDIAPLGIVAAQAAGLPAVLVENFTWDWIYQPYAVREPRFEEYRSYLGAVFDSADYRVRAEPACGEQRGDLQVAPIAREPRLGADVLRRRLGVKADRRLVLISMGGTVADRPTSLRSGGERGVHFVFAHGDGPPEYHADVTYLPTRSEFYHPDLINASDVVIGKIGYSTVAETFHCGVPFGFITRPGFRESDVLASFLMSGTDAIPITTEDYESGTWSAHLDALLDRPRRSQDAVNGADAVADFLLRLLPPSDTA